MDCTDWVLYITTQIYSDIVAFFGEKKKYLCQINP